jgi:hypothetical protein
VPHDFTDGGRYGFIAGHIEGQHLELLLACLGSPPAGAVDLVADLREPHRRGLADARRGAGHDRDLCSDPVHKLLQPRYLFLITIVIIDIHDDRNYNCQDR